MPKFRVKFRGDEEDEIIDAQGMTESKSSYVFMDGRGNTIAQIPRELVTIVREEEAGR